MLIPERIEDWFDREKRDLPWRQNPTPYRVWISEIMLQQTQVVKVIDYFNRFVGRFETIEQLARANEDEVLSYWSGLGYYSRCRNLHAAAKMIMREHHGEFPTSSEEILALPGIGSYTAGAILSFAFNQVAPVVDGNIARVLSRIYADFTPVDSTQGKKRFEELSLQLAKEARSPGKFQEGLMELGAMLCKPKSPFCEACPIARLCQARQQNNAELLPVKVKKIERKELHGVFAVIGDDEHIWLERNETSRLFKKLYAPPHLFIEDPENSKDALEKISKQFGFQMPKLPLIKTVIVRQLTHRVFYLHAFAIRKSPSELPNGKWFRRNELSKIGLSSAIAALLEKTQLLAFALLFLTGCMHSQKLTQTHPLVNEATQEPAIPSLEVAESNKVDRSWRDRVVKVARDLIGKKRVSFNGHHFRRDCSGTVRAIFEMAGVSLKKATTGKRQTDSHTLFDFAQRVGSVSDKDPDVGDLVFFNNTYDINRDGKFNDRFTHVGVVTKVRDDGQVLYVHYSHGRVIESTMQDKLRRGKRRSKGSTGAELFAGYGKLDKEG